MKHFMLVMALVIAAAVASAQSEKYTKAMQANISMLDSAMSKGNFVEIANNFERIGESEKTQWLPYYYAAYAMVSSTYSQTDKSKNDAIADKAMTLIEKAEAIAGKENSETCIVKSMIASAHLMVDPQGRWQAYGRPSAANIARAKSLDPTNPRAVYLEGQSKFYTPEAFGGGKGPAKELFTKALGMFDTFKPATSLSPSWGKAQTNYFLSLANN